MGETEQKLKELIISKYGSLNKFCEAINMPWTTLDSILKRGISKANITNIMKITKELNIDTESLAFGIISEKSLSNASDIDKNFKDIYKYYKDLNEAGQAEALKEYMNCYKFHIMQKPMLYLFLTLFHSAHL